MTTHTLFLPGFHLATLRRKPRSAAQKLAEEKAKIRHHSLSQLGECFGRFIPRQELAISRQGQFSRRRLFSKENTFWGFFSQILDADGGCQEVVRKAQAFAASRDLPIPSGSTSAYCQARSKLTQESLKKILGHMADILQQQGKENRWKGRRVIVVDGTGVSMPDTPMNQMEWPQSGTQKPGCGFPLARICACFCLQTGALLSYRLGSLRNAELPLLRQQWDCFKSGDIFLGDKGFCSYYDVWEFQNRGVDSVMTLARRTPVEASSAITVLGPDDLLIRWPKPAWNKNLSYSREIWERLPEHLTLRQIKVSVNTPGMRAESFYIVTTLTDAKAYSAHDLADLYYRRWDVELFFRDIKTTMAMEVLRCRTPALIGKEILMHFIVYNAVRLLIVDAARQVKIQPRRIGFKTGVQTLRQWEPQLNQAYRDQREQRRLIGLLIEAIGASVLTSRPGRREPRCLKRRPKPFALLTAPRHQMVETPHRSRYRAKQA